MVNSKRPWIWVAHDKRSGYDFSDARQFGETRAVFEGDFNPFDLKSDFAFVQKLMEESTADDWLILVGSGLACSLLSIAYYEKWKRLPVLVFHAHRREYVKREMSERAEAV